MSSVLARSLGLAPDQPIATDAAIVLVERRSPLTRTESRLVVLDYLGLTRDQIAAELGVSVETLKSYWKRVYRKIDKKLNAQARDAVRHWVEAILRADLEGDAPAGS